MVYPMNFGLDPSSFDAGTGAADAGLYDDPNATFMQRVLRAKQARDSLAAGGPQEPPPDKVTIPRVQAQAENPGFFSKHPGAGKGVDAAVATLALISNLRAEKKNRASGYYGHQTSKIDLGKMPTITGTLRSKAEKAKAEDLKLQGQNIGAAEAEARINESAMSRWATRRNAEMGQMMPSITKAAMRDPRAERAPSSFQQRLDALKTNQAYIDADPKTRNQMELRVISGQERTPEDTASAYAKAFARMHASIDARKQFGGMTGPGEEAKLRAMTAHMTDLIKNDFMDPEQAADEAIRFGANYDKLKGKAGYSGEAPPSPFQVAGNPMAPGQPAGAVVAAPTGQVRSKDAPGLPPDLQSKLKIYAAQINRHPERRAELRADLMRTYGVDPDQYIEPGQ